MAAVGASAMVIPTAALAHGSDTVWSGNLYVVQGWHTEAPHHSLTNVEFDGGYRSEGDLLGCVNAWNDSGGWAGETRCGYPETDHPYCGCQLRTGYAEAQTTGQVITDYQYVQGYWRQDW